MNKATDWGGWLRPAGRAARRERRTAGTRGGGPQPPERRLPADLERWLENSDGTSYATAADIAAVRAHDPACDSLEHVWLSHRGGHTDVCAIEDCPGCGITFYIEGTHYEEDSDQRWLEEGDEEYYDARWCTCCWEKWKARRRGEAGS